MERLVSVVLAMEGLVSVVLAMEGLVSVVLVACFVISGRAFLCLALSAEAQFLPADHNKSRPGNCSDDVCVSVCVCSLSGRNETSFSRFWCTQTHTHTLSLTHTHLHTHTRNTLPRYTLQPSILPHTSSIHSSTSHFFALI